MRKYEITFNIINDRSSRYTGDLPPYFFEILSNVVESDSKTDTADAGVDQVCILLSIPVVMHTNDFSLMSSFLSVLPFVCRTRNLLQL